MQELISLQETIFIIVARRPIASHIFGSSIRMGCKDLLYYILLLLSSRKSMPGRTVESLWTGTHSYYSHSRRSPMPFLVLSSAALSSVDAAVLAASKPVHCSQRALAAAGGEVPRPPPLRRPPPAAKRSQNRSKKLKEWAPNLMRNQLRAARAHRSARAGRSMRSGWERWEGSARPALRHRALEEWVASRRRRNWNGDAHLRRTECKKRSRPEEIDEQQTEKNTQQEHNALRKWLQQRH